MKVLIVGFWIVILLTVVAIEPLINPDPSDFLSFYYAGKVAAQGGDFYEIDALREVARREGATRIVYPYLYPPFLANLFSAFAEVPVDVLYSWWLKLLVLSSSVAAVLCCVVQRLWSGGDSTLLPSTIAAFCLFVLPFENNIAMGQVNLIVGAFVLLSCASYLSGYPALAGLLLVPAALIKVTPVLLVGFFVARRSRRAVMGFAAAAFVLLAISIVWKGSSAWVNYYSRLESFGYGKDIPGLFPTSTIFNFSPSGQLARLVSRQKLVGWIASLTTLVFLVATVLLAVRARTVRDEALALALFPPVSIMAGPLTYVHHVVYLTPSAIIWLTCAFVQSKKLVFPLVLVLLAISSMNWPGLYGFFGLLGRNAGVRAINLYAIVALWFSGWLAFRLNTR